jgi:hypothetical protein
MRLILLRKFRVLLTGRTEILKAIERPLEFVARWDSVFSSLLRCPRGEANLRFFDYLSSD